LQFSGLQLLATWFAIPAMSSFKFSPYFGADFCYFAHDFEFEIGPVFLAIISETRLFAAASHNLGSSYLNNCTWESAIFSFTSPNLVAKIQLFKPAADFITLKPSRRAST
jgi:hypothetical protein